MSPAAGMSLGQRQRLARGRLPAQREVRGDVAHDRAAQQAGRVVPADLLLLVRVLGGVVAVAGQRRQVDAADERDLVVDDHELLVVAVHHPRARVELALDLRAAHEPLARGLDLGAARLEDRHRRAGPHDHAHRDALGGLGQQLAHRPRVARAGVEVGLEVPRADVDVALGACGSPRRCAAARSRRRSAPRARCPSRGGAPVCAHRPSLAGASAASWPWRRRRRMWWWIIARSIPSPTAASKRSSSGISMRLPVPASLRSMASDQPTPQRLAAIREQMSLLSDYL